MIKTKEEALELCKKFDISLKNNDTVIVTGNNSIYLSDNIDPADKSAIFILKKDGNLIVDSAEKGQDEIDLEKQIADEEAAKQATSTEVTDTQTDTSKKGK